MPLGNMSGIPLSPKIRRASGDAFDAPEDHFHSQSVLPLDFEESDDEDNNRELIERQQEGDGVTRTSGREEKWKWWKIYTLHFLFVFNTRTYEYASIVLLALAFPHSLTATSIRGITSTVASLLCASAVGSWIDQASTRLPPLLLSIFVNHSAIVLVYLCWIIWPSFGSETDQQQALSFFEILLFTLILLLDIIQDLSAVANKLSLERDWIPALVGPITPDMVYGLTQVNAVLKRIDFICKLGAPSLLPLMISSFNSRVGWILLLACLTAVMWTLEVWCAFSVARDNEEVTAPKAYVEMSRNRVEGMAMSGSYSTITAKFQMNTWPRKVYTTLFKEPSVRLKHYFSTSIWQASIAISFLQLTVLAYSATLITYLLEVGFSLSAVTIARGSGSTMSLASTFITPWAVQYLRKRHRRRSLQRGPEESVENEKLEATIVRRVGLWGISSQVLSMIPVVIVLWNLSPKVADGTSRPTPPLLISVLLFSFLSLSRFGHLTFELMIQEIEQVEILPSQRSTFAGTEQSFESLAVLCHWTATIIWSQPEDFRWLALGSLASLATGAGMYATWVKKSKSTYVEVRYEGIAMDDVSSDVERHG